jgi:hypothetical protein
MKTTKTNTTTRDGVRHHSKTIALDWEDLYEALHGWVAENCNVPTGANVDIHLCGHGNAEAVMVYVRHKESIL